MSRPIRTYVAALAVAGCAESATLHPKVAQVERTCVGIPEAESRAVFTELRASVDRVEAVRERTKTKPFVERPVGADIHVRATPGMTAQWLGRLVHCHLVREECGASCESPACPLGLGRITTDVSTTAIGFTIAIRSNDDDVAREIARRALNSFGPGAMNPPPAVPPQTAAESSGIFAAQHL